VESLTSLVVDGGSMTDFFVSYDGDDRSDDDRVSHIRGRPVFCWSFDSSKFW
jgi:hypothetical protein